MCVSLLIGIAYAISLKYPITGGDEWRPWKRINGSRHSSFTKIIELVGNSPSLLHSRSGNISVKGKKHRSEGINPFVIQHLNGSHESSIHISGILMMISLVLHQGNSGQGNIVGYGYVFTSLNHL